MCMVKNVCAYEMSFKKRVVRMNEKKNYDNM
jgi:hypothetical protein